MTNIVLDKETLQIIALFSQLSSANVRDCIIDEQQIIFIVEGTDVGKAIGPKGSMIKKAEQMLKKRVKIVGYDADAAKFITNLCAPAKVKQVTVEGAVATITAEDYQNRGFIIGRSATTLRKYEAITKRYFPIDQLKVAGEHKI